MKNYFVGSMKITFSMRTIAFAILGKNFCIKVPMTKGINNPNAAVDIFEYGTGMFPLSKILVPKVNSQKGINPKDAKVAEICKFFK